MQEVKSKCPRCKGRRLSKAGIVLDRQRYHCKDCNYFFTRDQRGAPAELKRLALHLYLEGLGYRAISRIIGVSDVAIAKWINPVKDVLLTVRKENTKLNEMHKLEHFFVTKELFNRFGWLLIGIEENKDVCLLGSYTSGNCSLGK